MAGHAFDTLNDPMSSPIVPTFLLGDAVLTATAHPFGTGSDR